LSLIEELEGLQTRTVEAGGYEFQIQPISAADLAVAGRAGFLTIPVRALRDEGPDRVEDAATAYDAARAEVGAAAESGDEAAVGAAMERFYDSMERLQRVLQDTDPGAMRMAKEQEAAIVRAGVKAWRKPKGEWEPLYLVDGNRPSDPARGIMNARFLPPGAEGKLAEAILVLSQGEGWAEALAGFRGEPATTRPAGQAGEPPGVHDR